MYAITFLYFQSNIILGTIVFQKNTSDLIFADGQTIFVQHNDSFAKTIISYKQFFSP